MKKLLCAALASGLLAVVTAMQAGAQGTIAKVHGSGKDKLVVESGGEIAIASGGTITGAGAITAASIALTSSVSVATATAGGVTGRFRGAYTSTQLSTLSASPGDFAINSTITQLVFSSATSSALPGAWIMPSTSTVYTRLAGY